MLQAHNVSRVAFKRRERQVLSLQLTVRLHRTCLRPGQLMVLTSHHPQLTAMKQPVIRATAPTP